MNTLPIGPFLGVNNKLPPFALHVDKVGYFLSGGVNIDIDDDHRIRRRIGPTRLVEMSGAHSLFNGHLVRDAVLYAVTLPTYIETLLKVLTSDTRLSWVKLGDDLYYSNGTDSGRITNGVWYPLGLPTPSAPTVETTAGSFPAGKYQVAVSYHNATTGEEGGVSAKSYATIINPAGLRVTLPSAAVGATHVEVYLSTDNGSVVKHAASVVTGTAYVDFASVPAVTRDAPERIEVPLPAGELFESNGRLCSFSGNTVYVGLPWRYGYHHPEDFVRFHSDVTVAIANQFGTYICADKTYWIPGDLSDVQESIRDVLPFGAVRGTAFTMSHKPFVGWFSQNGVVIGDTVGQVTTPMIDNISLTPPDSGVSLFLDLNGYRRVISCGWFCNVGHGAATPYSGWDFTSYDGGYATAPDGIYKLDGDSKVDAHADLGQIDFGTEAVKRLPTAYAGMASSAPLELTVRYTDDRNIEREYSYPTRSYGESLQMQRFDTALGLRANWFGLTVSNTEGEDFTLASISFAATASTRRI